MKLARGAVYVIGSLRNPRVPAIAAALREAGYDAFDDWYAAGPEADDIWQHYERERGRVYAEGLAGWHAGHVYDFDRHHLTRCDAGVLVLPAGKSAHIELGFVVGQGKPGYILMESGEPDRWDVMYKFATVVYDLPQLLVALGAGDAH